MARIRPVTGKDYVEVRALLGLYGMSEGLISETFYVMVLQDEIIACGGFVAQGGIAWVISVAVLPDWRGQGLGRKMVDHVIGRIVEQQPAQIWLETLFWNIAFYEKVGFSHVPVKTVPDGIAAMRQNRRCCFMRFANERVWPSRATRE